MIIPGPRVSIGVSGSGKTHGLERMSEAAAIEGVPVVRVDLLNEVDSIPKPLENKWAPIIVRHTDEKRIAESIAKAVAAGKTYVILRPDIGSTPDSLAGGAWRWARGDGVSRRTGRARAGVAISEAHEVLPNGRSLHPFARQCIVQWRHYDVAIWIDTQRAAEIHKTPIAQSIQTRLYAIVGKTDLDVVRELGGRELEDAVQEAGRRLDPVEHGGLGEPGWHVLLRLTRRPPYELVRDSYG